DYNECRPHSALNYQTPSEFAARWRNGKCEGKQTDLTNSRLYLILGAGHSTNFIMARQKLVKNYHMAVIEFVKVSTMPTSAKVQKSSIVPMLELKHV
ncbi:TPA: hypothetical protein ACPEY1_005740, partial [Klebsiella pneumoniae]|nr:hypothetical protein [Klebsiella pneumoniae]